MFSVGAIITSRRNTTTVRGYYFYRILDRKTNETRVYMQMSSMEAMTKITGQHCHY